MSTDGSNWTSIGEGYVEGRLYKQDLSLNSYAGKSIYIRFRFDLVDSLYNNHLGWLLDNVAVNILDTKQYIETFDDGGLDWNRNATSSWHIVDENIGCFNNGAAPFASQSKALCSERIVNALMILILAQHTMSIYLLR